MELIEIRITRHNATHNRVRALVNRFGGKLLDEITTARHATVKALTPVGSRAAVVAALEAREGVLSVRTR
jgi:hypothetical protein